MLAELLKAKQDAKEPGLIFVLWGGYAQKLKKQVRLPE